MTVKHDGSSLTAMTVQERTSKCYAAKQLFVCIGVRCVSRIGGSRQGAELSCHGALLASWAEATTIALVVDVANRDISDQSSWQRHSQLERVRACTNDSLTARGHNRGTRSSSLHKVVRDDAALETGEEP